MESCKRRLTVTERRNPPESPFMKMAGGGGGSRKYSTVEHLRVPQCDGFCHNVGKTTGVYYIYLLVCTKPRLESLWKSGKLSEIWREICQRRNSWDCSEDVCEIATVVVFVKFFCLCVESKIETKTLMFGKALKIHLFDSTCEIV